MEKKSNLKFFWVCIFNTSLRERLKNKKAFLGKFVVERQASDRTSPTHWTEDRLWSCVRSLSFRGARLADDVLAIEEVEPDGRIRRRRTSQTGQTTKPRGHFRIRSWAGTALLSCKLSKLSRAPWPTCTVTPVTPRIIYIRFYSKSAFLLRWIKNQNTEAEIKKLIVETFGHL